MHHHVPGPDALIEHLQSGVQGTDALLPTVPDSIFPSHAALSLLFKLFIEAGHCSLQLGLDLGQLSRKLFKCSDPSQSCQSLHLWELDQGLCSWCRRSCIRWYSSRNRGCVRGVRGVRTSPLASLWSFVAGAVAGTRSSDTADRLAPRVPWKGMVPPEPLSAIGVSQDQGC